MDPRLKPGMRTLVGLAALSGLVAYAHAGLQSAASVMEPGEQRSAQGAQVVSVDKVAQTLVVRIGGAEQTLSLSGIGPSALAMLEPGQELRLSLRDAKTATGFVITGPVPRTPASADPRVLPTPPPSLPSTLPATTRQGRVVGVDVPGLRLAVAFGEGDKMVSLEGIAARTISMVDPGEDVLLYLRDSETAVAFVITGWPQRP
jgi:hypothetical protein